MLTMCGNHFTIRVCQSIMSYTLNLYNAVVNYISTKLEKIQISGLSLNFGMLRGSVVAYAGIYGWSTSDGHALFG